MKSMLKIVLDANIFISSILNPHGTPSQVIDLIEVDKLQLIISPTIITEIKRVFMSPKICKRHKKSYDEITEYLDKLFAIAQLTSDSFTIEGFLDDPDDNKYLECAMEGQADFIISGDQHLKILQAFQGIPIVSPDEFLQIYRSIRE